MYSIRLCILVIVLILTSISCLAQSVEEAARRDVDSLTSPGFKGRGYYHDGAARAADYIRDRFRTMGLESIGEDYFQEFPITVNEVIETPSLILDKDTLRPGLDFLPEVSSPSGRGDRRHLVDVGSGLYIPEKGISDYESVVRGSVAILEMAVSEETKRDSTIDPKMLSLGRRIMTAHDMGAKAIIIPVERLTFGKSQEQWPIPVFEVLREHITSEERLITFSLKSRLIETTSRNVIARIPGTTSPDSMIILCGHYDHLGTLGDSIYFPGANDNASGVAMILSLARYFKEHPLKYTLVIIAFSGEEAGLVGSGYFVLNPLVDLSRVKFLVNTDMTASGAEGIMAVGGVESPSEFALLAAVADSLGLKDVRKRENAPNSDHYFFAERGVRGFYIYPFTGYQPYHHVNDRPETLEWNVFWRLHDILRGFIVGLNR